MYRERDVYIYIYIYIYMRYSIQYVTCVFNVISMVVIMIILDAPLSADPDPRKLLLSLF